MLFNNIRFRVNKNFSFHLELAKNVPKRVREKANLHEKLNHQMRREKYFAAFSLFLRQGEKGEM